MNNVSQLTLQVQLPDDETFASFISKTNIVAVKQIQHFIEQVTLLDKQMNSLYIFGLSSVGKSHLLHACSNYVDSLGASSVCLSFSELTTLSVDVLIGLENIDLVCLDDVQLISGDHQWQQAVFDLYNRIIENNKCLIITGDQSVNELGITLPDLVSRLSWGLTEQIKPLQDEEKRIALQHRASQRGLLITDDVANFLINRVSRDMANLLQILNTLDQASIREQRKVTIPFVKEVLSL